jgi:serine/threonine protein kinase/tetratricopeptide (TPR) repeat protein
VPHRTLQPGTTFAGYVIQRELGRGGTAVVYLAEDPKHHRSVALKVLQPGLAASSAGPRFLQEIGIAATLTHPNILPLYDSGEEDGRLYYVMPFVEPGSLRQRLEREPQLPVPEAVRITREVADALAYAHGQGIIHRDVKPENILFEGEHPVVVDFGVARAVSEAAGRHLTDEGAVVGTPAYMSPEQASGDSDIGPAADQYALACVLYEMLAGQPPFTGANARAVLARHVVDRVPPLATVRPGVPRPVRRALIRAMSKAPADRFATIRDFATALVEPAAEDDEGSSIAVLPFTNMSDSPDDEYFADGMAEEIITALSKIEGLHVMSRTSSFAFKGKAMDVRGIGEMLNVRAVLEGSVRRSGNTLRITAQLVNAADGYHLWSGRYDCEPKDVFAVQEEIAASIAQALRVVLRDETRRAISRAQPSDIEAYDFYLRGLQFLHQRRKKSLVFARQMFKRAIERDPGFARGYAGIAEACALLDHFFPREEDHVLNLEQADAASRKALELDPNLPDAHATRGFVLWLLDRYPEAEREFRRAIEIDPRHFEARYLYARACFQRGELEQAARLFAEAGRLQEDYEALYFAAQAMSALGRRAEAEAGYRRALPAIERHLELNPDDARAITVGAVAFSRLGDRRRGLEWAERAVAVDPEDASVSYNVACLFALEGERDRALERLQSALRAGFAHWDWIEHDPDLDSLRQDPRFQALLAER